MYWEDFAPGSVAEYGSRLLTREEIIAFAAEFDPQPMHLDEDAARATLLGGLSASGWHSCCVLMRLIADGLLLNSSSMGSPGVDEVRWLKPVRPGSTLTLRAHVVETRASRSRPHAGLVRFAFDLRDKAAESVMTLHTSLMFGRRSPAAALGAPAPAPPQRASGKPRSSPSVGAEADPSAAAEEAGMQYFEDIPIGEKIEIGRHTFTASDIKAFAMRFDPQLFHLDEAEAARSHFGALCASGWHTAVMWMRLMVDYRRRAADAQLARGEKLPELGPSPGFRDLKWLSPVYAGDTITYATEVVAKRPSASRPKWGLKTIRNTGVNQDGEPVISFISTVLVERRSAA